VSSGYDKFSATLILLGSFSLALWLVSTMLFSKDFLIQIIYGVLSAFFIFMIYQAFRYKSPRGKVIIAFSGSLLGVMVALSWATYNFSLVNSMVIAGVGTLLLLYGFYGVE